MPDTMIGTAQRMISYADAVRDALTVMTLRDPSVLIMAEGVDDPASMFGTTKGIAKAAGAHRVVEMPLAENALTGVAIGAAMSGRRPVISLQRVEFALLAIEQIANNAAKAHYISNGQHKVPLVIRMVVGRGWGQGPEHSQSLEALFALFPGLKVLMPTYPRDAKGMTIAAIEDDNPVIVIEHRWCHYVMGDVPEGYYREPLTGPRALHEGKDITIVSTSYMTLEAVRAADALRALGYSATVFDLRVLRPLNLEPIFESVRRTGRLLTVDTGWRKFGIGAEIVSEVATNCFAQLKTAPMRLGLPDHPAPSSRGLVRGYYTDTESILRTAASMLGIDAAKIETAVAAVNEKRKTLPIDAPDPFFKGPF
jgi:pyruvate dehydrogenase E1 component beta subunit